MRKIREILRLRHEMQLGLRAIARSCQVSHNTVKEVLRRTEEAGLDWAQARELDEVTLEAKLYPATVGKFHPRPLPDWCWVHRELRRPGVTLRLLWREYKQMHPDGLQYSQFCERYRRWRETLDVVLRQTYQPGEKMFVDYAGQTVPVRDPKTGEIREAHIFVTVLGASNYTYLEAHSAQDLVHWIGGHVRAFEYYRGVPAVVVPDNPKTGVKRACWYEPELNPTYQELAVHYGFAVIPARPRKPRDKAKVEAGVLVVERWVLARLRNRTFLSLSQLNDALAALREELNERPFQKLDGCRRSLFEQLERPALRPLPSVRYEWAEWRKARVNIDYHVEVDKNFYSVPYTLVRQEVEVRLTALAVEVFHKGQRVASHPRLAGQGRVSTNPEHRPAAHRRYLEWSPSRLIKWAETVGPHTARLVQGLLESKPHPEQGYRACLGLLRLAKQYGSERMEAAAHRALAHRAFSYRSVKSMLETGLDRMPLPSEADQAVPPHENVRGSSYYGSEGGRAC